MLDFKQDTLLKICMFTFIRVFKDMEMRLMEEGLNHSASGDEKMCLLWKLLMNSEETVRALKQQIRDLHKQHNTEIEKVRGRIKQDREMDGQT